MKAWKINLIYMVLCILLNPHISFAQEQENQDFEFNYQPTKNIAEFFNSDIIDSGYFSFFDSESSKKQEFTKKNQETSLASNSFNQTNFKQRSLRNNEGEIIAYAQDSLSPFGFGQASIFQAQSSRTSSSLLNSGALLGILILIFIILIIFRMFSRRKKTYLRNSAYLHRDRFHDPRRYHPQSTGRIPLAQNPLYQYR